MKVLRGWWWGLTRPQRAAELLKGTDTPWLGLQAVLVRGLLDALLLFLPLYLLGRQPSHESWLLFITTGDYFLFLVFFSPFFFLYQWLFLSALVYLLANTGRGRFSINPIMNIFGVTGLVVGSFLVVWDWVWVLAGSKDYMALGVTHLVADVWAIILTVYLLRKGTGMEVGRAVILNLVWLVAGIPWAMVFMRSPL